VKLWFDEDLSPTLVTVAHAHGIEATCNRDRGLLGSTDRDLRRVVQAEGFVLVTDNGSDFRPMYRREAIHPGLILMPGVVGRGRQQHLLGGVIDWIVRAAQAASESAEDYMLNRLVEIDEFGACAAQELPAPG
jgi:predicted nuclease of predicted toxin-antitoxin system